MTMQRRLPNLFFRGAKLTNCKICKEEIDLGYGPDGKFKWVHAAGGAEHARNPYYHKAEPNPKDLNVSKELLDRLIKHKEKLASGKLIETPEDAFTWMIETGKLIGHAKKDATFFNKDWKKQNK